MIDADYDRDGFRILPELLSPDQVAAVRTDALAPTRPRWSSNGYLLHRSLPNTGRHGMRRALVNHYMSAESLLPWFAPTAPEPMAMLDTAT